MFAKELMDCHIPFLYEGSSGKEAIVLMEKFKLHHLPVVEKDKKYKCLISDKELSAMENINDRIQVNDIRCPFVYENSSWTEVLDITAQFKLSILPVIAENNIYQGSATLELFIQKLAEVMGTGEEGSIIILETKPEDYSLSAISAIIEANKAKILSMFTTYEKETRRNEIYLKINRQDASAIIQGFERQNYTVRTCFMPHAVSDTILQNRIDEFFHYLNI
ncbi:MAG: CBS domain-containing protein [Candidatus Azobacteroides sp.]|nr:CBS domain-containing protein [Candidatus Azobacteroides sp.]